MPDLKSELSKLQSLSNLSFDDAGQDSSEPVVVSPTAGSPNKRQAIWMYVTQNPNTRAKDICSALSFSAAEVSSALQKMTINGSLTRKHVDGSYVYKADTAKYPTRRPYTRKAEPKASKSPAPVKAGSILDTMSVREARDLYEELKTIFSS
jgi:hypothetical protein